MKPHFHILACFLGTLLVTGCGDSVPDAAGDAFTPAPTEDREDRALTDLPDRIDCVRESGGLIVAAHRGGPAPGYPENAVETLQYALQAGVPAMEIDVAESRDGTLFLMHDRSLTRTTTGSGAVAETDWSTIRGLKLVDNDGKVTSYAPPTLAEALEWAVDAGAILELDRKPTTSFRNIIEAVRKAGAEANVIVITYSDEEAWQVARLAPDLMMTAGVGNREHEAELLDGGVDPARLIAWTGTSRPSPGKWKGLASKGIESAFGTLGRPGERLDDTYWADGDPSEYTSLVEAGLVLLATDEPYAVVRSDGLLKTASAEASDCLQP
jgi:glycerophosphoryl diester phosphodiesterase